MAPSKTHEAFSLYFQFFSGGCKTMNLPGACRPILMTG